MANKKLQGITIQIDGDTKPLSDSLKSVNDEIFKTAKELREVERSLKFDPSNIDLWYQKQQLLTKAIDDTEAKLNQLKAAKQQADADPGVDKNSEAYRVLVRELSATQNQFDKLQKEQEDVIKTTASLRGEVENVAEGIEEVGKAADNGAKSTSTFGDMLKANLTSQAVMGALHAVADGIKSVVSTGIEYNAQMETFSAGITAMLKGDKEAADGLLNSMKEIASASSFDTASFVEASQSLLAAGVSADKAEATIKALGDAVAFTGGGNAELTRMAQNLQQIQNVGKASSMDIKQFANAGIDVYGILSDYLGKNVEEIQKMDISFDDLSNALIQAGGEGGRYFGAMASQANTFTGQVNKLKSGMTELAGSITEDITAALQNEFLPVLNDTVTAMSKGFKENGIEGMIDAMQEGLQTMITKIVDKLPDIINAGIKIMLALVKGIIESIPKLVKRLPEIIKAIVEGLADLIPDIAKVGADIVRGLWEGIKGLGSWLGEKIKGFGNTIVSSFKNFFGIASPSKLMKKQIGENIAAGIGEGIEAGMPAALEDVDAAMKQLNAGIEASVNPVINTSANTSPLIIQIENFNNNRESDIQSLAEQLEYYRRNMSLAKGGEY